MKMHDDNSNIIIARLYIHVINIYIAIAFTISILIDIITITIVNLLISLPDKGHNTNRYDLLPLIC